MKTEEVHPKAYLAGCLNGDAYLSKTQRRHKHGTFGLTAKDLDFVQMFAICIRKAYGFEVNVNNHGAGYFVARRYNSKGIFNDLELYQPVGLCETASWIRGVFDSDGSAVIGSHKNKGENSRYRTISICGSYIEILEKAGRYLLQLGIGSKIHATKLGKDHYGTKPIYRLQIVGGRNSHERFASLIGSSIKRKMDKLREIVSTYCNLDDERRAAQLLGAKSKNAKRIALVIPYVLDQIKRKIIGDRNPRLRECLSIKGYGSLLKYHNHLELVSMAKEEFN